MTKTKFDIRYDRTVSDPFLGHFTSGGVAEWLVTASRSALYPLDLQFRKSPKTLREHASLYVGLTSVLNVEATKSGLRLTAHPTWATKPNGWQDAWAKAHDDDYWRANWGGVELYLERVIPKATKSHGLTEGAVQAAVSSHGNVDRVMLDREVVPSFRDTPYKREVMSECMEPILRAVNSQEFQAGKVPQKFGAECDLLALDSTGRILAVEVKPLAGGGVAWVAAQAAMYARVLQRWIDVDGHPRSKVTLERMLAQRREVGLLDHDGLSLPDKLTVTPVVALQRGASDLSKERMLNVCQAVNEQVDLGVPPVEIHEVSLTGKMVQLK